MTHYGIVVIGDRTLEAVVLDDRRRGFIQRPGVSVLAGQGRRFRPEERMVGELVAFVLKSALDGGQFHQAQMPHGETVSVVDARLVPHLIASIIDGALDGTLVADMHHRVPAALVCMDVMSSVGIVPLVDEATGYQYERGAHELQEILNQEFSEDMAGFLGLLKEAIEA